MALINRAKKEINAKIVYFGPPFAGKTATLEHIYKKLQPDFRGVLKSMAVQDDRMFFFDFLPLGAGTLEGYTVRVHLYTAPGVVSDAAAWKLVLKGVDGLVFVADSTAGPEANRESLEQLQELLRAYGTSIDEIPLTVQCNKCDVDGAAPPAAVADILGVAGAEAVATSAATGQAVISVLSSTVKEVLETIRRTQLEGGAEGPLRMAALEMEEPAIATEVSEVEPAFSTEAEPQLLLGGTPEALGGGLLRLPLVIRFNGREKKVGLTMEITLED